jgi:hypothetical protein
MKREDIIKLANDMAFFASIWIDEDSNEVNDLVKFAKLVADKERKEICGTVQQIVPITSWAHELLDAIRARGEA